MKSLETRTKISNKLKGIKKSPDTITNMSKAKQAQAQYKYTLNDYEENNLIYDYTVNKISVRECGIKYGLSRRIVQGYLKKHNIKLRSIKQSHQKPIDKNLEDKIITLYNQRKNLTDIAKELNITRSYVYKIVRKNGCNRPRGEDKKGVARPESVKQQISTKNKGHKVNLEKQIETKRKNHSFNISRPEQQMLEELKLKFGSDSVKYNYKDTRYPYYCDFYIPSRDLFIELNAHWTHGGRPFDPNDLECQAQLKVWQEKAKTSKFYQQAIYIWTKLDPKKQKCAKDNNLNYLTIY